MGFKERNAELLEKFRYAAPGSAEASETMAALWETNQALIRYTVHNLTGLSPSDQDFEDMTQQAYFDFVVAVQTYDPNAGAEFSTYAAKRIRWGLCRYYNMNGYAMRIPAFMKQRIKLCLEKKRELEAKEGHAVSYAAALQALNFSPTATQGVLTAIQRIDMISLDEPAGGNNGKDGSAEGVSFLDRIAACEDVEEAATVQVWHQELHDVLMLAVMDLPQEAAVLIIRRYFQGVPLIRMAEELGVTKQAIYAKKRAAFRAIRSGRYGEELAEFMPDMSGKARAERLIKEAREKVEHLKLSEGEKELLVL